MLTVDICQLFPGSFMTQKFLFPSSTGIRPVLSSTRHCFYPKLLFVVCCTAFSIHICLFIRGAILLGIESVYDRLRYETDMLRSNSKSLGNLVVSPEEEKERLRTAVERICRKGRF